MCRTRRQGALCNYVGGMAILDEKLDKLVGGIGVNDLWRGAIKVRDVIGSVVSDALDRISCPVSSR